MDVRTKNASEERKWREGVDGEELTLQTLVLKKQIV